MEPSFWHERWALGEIGFHRSAVHWGLTAHWSSLSIARGETVLVPLCGKTMDLHWLVAQGHPVVGVELDHSAIEAFFTEWPSNVQDPKVQISETPSGQRRYESPTYSLWQADFFDLSTEPRFEAFYDRAALIAMPPAMRSNYLDKLHSLVSPQAKGLLVSFEYDINQMDGPPFSVSSEEVIRHGAFDLACLERRDVIADHKGMQAKGLSALTESVYLMTPR